MKDFLSELLPKNFHAPDKEKEKDPAGKAHALALARELLLVGENNEDLVKKYLEILIDNGLPKTKGKLKPKKVLIVGAGITGLTAGSLLKQAGHDVTIIEANANRIGGRIKTFHKNPFDPTVDPPFEDPKQYAEAGAMRLPSFHPLVLALIDKFKLKRQLFYNVSIDPKTGDTSGPIPSVKYEPFDYSGDWSNGDNPDWKAPTQLNNTWIRTNGLQVRKNQYKDGGDKVEAINKGFEMKDSDFKKTTAQLLDEVLNPVRDRYSNLMNGTRPKKGKVDEWVEAWASIIYDLDGFSMYGFLKKFARKEDGSALTNNEIEAIGTIENLTSRLALSFMHSFLGRADINPEVTYYEIEGGSWLLPYAYLPELYNNIVMNRRMTHIEYFDPKKNKEQGYTPIHTSNKPGERISVRTLSETKDGEGAYTYEEEIFKADYCLITIPFSSLRHVTVSPMFSYKKRRAIIELHYDAATKVVLEFNQRWWEFKNEKEWAAAMKKVEKNLGKTEYDRQVKIWKERDPRPANEQKKPIISNYVGGGNVTDNPNRFIYVPSHKIQGSEGGVILASYSWSDDARRWDSMADEDRYKAALRGLIAIHGWQAALFYTGKGKTQSWNQNPYAFGEAAVFTPGQMTAFHLDIPTAEGPVHFAGEHVSLKHAWIEGCLETGTRAALEIHKAVDPKPKRTSKPKK